MTAIPTTVDEVPATIHGPGSARLDAVVDLVRSLALPRPLATVLDEIPPRVSRVFASEVCSIYLREGDDLVMRGNVGFVNSAVGEVRLAVGEGLVGLAVELMRPVTAEVAATHERYRSFPSLGEERYPAFVAVPVPGPSGPTGAVVVQRARGPYTPTEVELLVALSGAVAPVFERARIIEPRRPNPAPASGTRRVTLTGRGIVKGRALGVIASPRRPGPRAFAGDTIRAPREQAKVLGKALHALDATLDSVLRAAGREGMPTAAPRLWRMLLDDGRLRERTLEVARGRGLGPALAQVAREATRAARLTDDAHLVERAQETSELCDALRCLILGERHVVAPRAAVWVADEVTVFDLVMAARFTPVALVLGGKVESERERELIDYLGVPTVSEVDGLWGWVSEGDVALVDGDHGLVRSNPTRRERDEARVDRHADRGAT